MSDWLSDDQLRKKADEISEIQRQAEIAKQQQDYEKNAPYQNLWNTVRLYNSAILQLMRELEAKFAQRADTEVVGRPIEVIPRWDNNDKWTIASPNGPISFYIWLLECNKTITAPKIHYKYRPDIVSIVLSSETINFRLQNFGGKLPQDDYSKPAQIKVSKNVNNDILQLREVIKSVIIHSELKEIYSQRTLFGKTFYLATKTHRYELKDNELYSSLSQLYAP